MLKIGRDPTLINELLIIDGNKGPMAVRLLDQTGGGKISGGHDDSFILSINVHKQLSIKALLLS